MFNIKTQGHPEEFLRFLSLHKCFTLLVLYAKKTLEWLKVTRFKRTQRVKRVNMGWRIAYALDV
jgi:hypothetical protein